MTFEDFRDAAVAWLKYDEEIRRSHAESARGILEMGREGAEKQVACCDHVRGLIHVLRKMNESEFMSYANRKQGATK